MVLIVLDSENVLLIYYKQKIKHFIRDFSSISKTIIIKLNKLYIGIKKI